MRMLLMVLVTWDDLRKGRDAVQDPDPGPHLLDVRDLRHAGDLHGQKCPREAPVHHPEDNDGDQGFSKRPKDQGKKADEACRRRRDVEATDDICEESGYDPADDAACVHGRNDVERR